METEVEPKKERQPDQATLLLNRLRKFHGKKPLVIASSISSIDLAKKIARELGGDYMHVLVKKLTDPANPMRVVGAVTEWAGVCISPEAVQRGITLDVLEETIHHYIEQMQRYRLQHPSHVDPEKRALIFVDTGSRTGFRLAAVLQSIKTFIPRIAVVATPEISHRAFALVNELVDDIIALKVTPSPKT